MCVLENEPQAVDRDEGKILIFIYGIHHDNKMVCVCCVLSALV